MQNAVYTEESQAHDHCWFLLFLFFLEKVIDWILPYTQYQNQLVDQAALMMTLSGRVSETQQVLANQTSFRLRTPDITIEVRHPEPSAAF